MSDLDELEGFATPVSRGRPGRPRKRANFGTIGFGSRIKCADCDRPGIVKSGKLWFCRGHAPRTSE